MKYKKCHHCNGKGVNSGWGRNPHSGYNEVYYEECSHCNGTGKLKIEDYKSELRNDIKELNDILRGSLTGGVRKYFQNKIFNLKSEIESYE